MDAITTWLADRLLAGSLQGAGVIGIVWLTTRLVPRMPVAAQSALWWLAAAKLILAFVPTPAIPIPVLPPAHSTTPAVVMNAGTAVSPVATAVLVGPRTADDPTGPWAATLIALWLAAMLIQAVRLITSHRRLRLAVRRSTPWSDDAAAAVAPLARLVGLRRVPRISTSNEVGGPQVTGLIRPIVLLPPSVGALTADERTMMLCHELVHIRRRDLAFGWVPALAERLFFFHPLARLAAREYLTSREAACDAAVVRALNLPPADYGQLLVRLGIASSPSALVAGGSPSSMSSLRRRLEMLQHTDFPGQASGWRWLIAGAALALVPIQLVARTPVGVPQRELARPAAVVESAVELTAAVDAPAAPAAAPETRAQAAPAPPARDRAGEGADAPATAAAQLAEAAAVMRRMLEEESHRTQTERMRAEIEAAREHFEQLQAQTAARPEVEAMLEAIAEQTRQRRRDFEASAQQIEVASRQEARVMTQLEALTRQQEQLATRLIEIATQQERLVEAQQRLAEAAEQLRKAIEAR